MALSRNWFGFVIIAKLKNYSFNGIKQKHSQINDRLINPAISILKLKYPQIYQFLQPLQFKKAKCSLAVVIYWKTA
ncbi:MAG: hypothetical protein C0615_05605 [Desulfuromonas sp.]|nr:MAG: hypothetical protein C0615_05605 [Desulfuromonas sp.]